MCSFEYQNPQTKPKHRKSKMKPWWAIYRISYSGKSSQYHVSGCKFKIQKSAYLKNFSSYPCLLNSLITKIRLVSLNGNSQSLQDLDSSTNVYSEVTKQRCTLLLQTFNVPHRLYISKIWSEESITPWYWDHFCYILQHLLLLHCASARRPS